MSSHVFFWPTPPSPPSDDVMKVNISRNWKWEKTMICLRQFIKSETFLESESENKTMILRPHCWLDCDWLRWAMSEWSAPIPRPEHNKPPTNGLPPQFPISYKIFIVMIKRKHIKRYRIWNLLKMRNKFFFFGNKIYVHNYTCLLLQIPQQKPWNIFQRQDS